MDEFIEKLKLKIFEENTTSMNESQEYYVAGLSDALALAKEMKDVELKVGKCYYVIMYQEKQHLPYIQKLLLYKITYKAKRFYCFTDNIENGQYHHNVLTLSNKVSIMNRVFDTLEEAENRVSQ